MGTESTVSSPPAIRRVGIVAKSRLHEAAALLDEIVSWLEARGVEALFEMETADLAAGRRTYPTRTRADLPRDVDLLLVLGGDGTLLSMADRIAHAGTDVPILGVNFGSLGFLTEVTLPELYPALEAVVRGRARFESRMMVRCRILRRDVTVADMPVLNDIVVTRGSVSRVIDLSVSVDDQLVARFKADGVIVATPTGSTAYNLAAGGPIVCPAVDALVLTPIAPHTLTNRPVVLPASSVVRIQPGLDDTQEVFVTFDGQDSASLHSGDVVTVERALVPLRLVKAATRTYFDVLRQKLKWAER